MQEEKKQLEILLMDYFRKYYPEFPGGKVVSSESPDFVVKMKNRHQLGIELTRLNPANALLPDTSQKEEIAFREDFITFCKELYEHHLQIPLFVKFLFAENERLTPESKLFAAARVSNLIRNAAKKRKSNNFYSYSFNKSDLPNGLDQLFLAFHPKLETAIWERSNNLGVSNNVVDDVHKAIQKKDEKLRLYQKQRLNYYWLLITTDRLRGVKSLNLVNKIMNQQFDSQFQKVFLFDLLKSPSRSWNAISVISILTAKKTASP